MLYLSIHAARFNISSHVGLLNISYLLLITSLFNVIFPITCPDTVLNGPTDGPVVGHFERVGRYSLDPRVPHLLSDHREASPDLIHLSKVRLKSRPFYFGIRKFLSENFIVA